MEPGVPSARSVSARRVALKRGTLRSDPEPRAAPTHAAVGPELGDVPHRRPVEQRGEPPARWTSARELRASRDHYDGDPRPSGGPCEPERPDLVDHRPIREDGVRSDEYEPRAPDHVTALRIGDRPGRKPRLPKLSGKPAALPTGPALEDEDPFRAPRRGGTAERREDGLAPAQGHYETRLRKSSTARSEYSGELNSEAVALPLHPRPRSLLQTVPSGGTGHRAPFGRPAQKRTHGGLGPVQGASDLSNATSERRLALARPIPRLPGKDLQGLGSEHVGTVTAVSPNPVERRGPRAGGPSRSSRSPLAHGLRPRRPPVY
jgi:hypothetical protein